MNWILLVNVMAVSFIFSSFACIVHKHHKEDIEQEDWIKYWNETHRKDKDNDKD